MESSHEVALSTSGGVIAVTWVLALNTAKALTDVSQSIQESFWALVAQTYFPVVVAALVAKPGLEDMDLASSPA